MELRELGVLMKSVPPQQHAAFVSLLAALSLVAIYTLGLSTSFYRLYYEIAVPGGSGLVVSSYAASPITSVIDRSLVEKLLGNATGAQVEYAVFSIAYVGGRLVVVRGLDRGLAAFPDSGELCYYCAVVGGELAEDLNVSEGSLLPLHSVLSGRSVLIYVYRVEDLPPPYRYEVLCGTDLVRELRGIGKNSYSIAVVKSENLSVLRELAAKLGIGESEVGILRRALLVLTQRGLRTVLEVRKDLPEVYIGRLGIHRELLYYLTYSTAAVFMLCLP
ncbi:MAG: hypothetical protein NZ925_03585, partial [Sulfolobales archaeon]|nr:hypothetical protein [Sulfolobales archaeon]